jgi:hypothetical protein
MTGKIIGVKYRINLEMDNRILIFLKNSITLSAKSNLVENFLKNQCIMKVEVLLWTAFSIMNLIIVSFFIF